MTTNCIEDPLWQRGRFLFKLKRIEHPLTDNDGFGRRSLPSDNSAACVKKSQEFHITFRSKDW